MRWSDLWVGSPDERLSPSAFPPSAVTPGGRPIFPEPECLAPSPGGGAGWGTDLRLASWQRKACGLTGAAAYQVVLKAPPWQMWLYLQNFQPARQVGLLVFCTAPNR